MKMRYLLLLLSVPAVAHADSNSNGPFGINAGWTLPGKVKVQGQGIGIGQVEPGRVGKPGYDVHPDDHHDAIKTFAVYNDGQLASPGDAIEEHATNVAGIMIADATEDVFPAVSFAGVSPQGRYNRKLWT